MLYVFTGSDTAAAKVEARKRATGYEVVVVGEGGVPHTEALGYVGSSGLFSPRVALIIDRPLETAEGTALLEQAAALHEAETPVFIIEPDLGAAEKKLLPKGVKVERFERQGMVAEERPNVFAFTDAFMAEDKKRSWIEYRHLIESGIAPEEIHGALMWAVRSALLALKTKSATESGLKPFVYSKSKTVANKLGPEKIADLSRSLVRAYHRARLGEGDLEMFLESLVLQQ